MADHPDENTNIKDIFSKGRNLFASLKKDKRSSEDNADETVAALRRFIKNGGGDVLQGKNSFALLTKTARHINALSREQKRHCSSEEQQHTPLNDVTDFFGKLQAIRFKKDASQTDETELSEINLELFPKAERLQITGIQVIHVKSGDNVTSLTLDDEAAFSDDLPAKVFPQCTEIEMVSCNASNILHGLSSTLLGVTATESIVSSSLLSKYCLNLVRLEIINCGWTELPVDIQSLVSLQALSLSQNKISDVSKLGSLPLLGTLDISNNNIESLDFLYENNGNLHIKVIESLDVSGNPISSLKGIGPWLSSLIVLNAQNCQVEEFEELQSLARLEKLMSITLTGNPIYNISTVKSTRQVV